MDFPTILTIVKVLVVIGAILAALHGIARLRAWYEDLRRLPKNWPNRRIFQVELGYGEASIPQQAKIFRQLERIGPFEFTCVVEGQDGARPVMRTFYEFPSEVAEQMKSVVQSTYRESAQVREVEPGEYLPVKKASEMVAAAGADGPERQVTATAASR